MSSDNKTSKIKVPVTFVNFVNKHLNKQLQNAIQKDLVNRGLGTLGSPDLRNTKERMKTKKRITKEVVSKFKKENPSAVTRIKSLRKKN
tara:strand:- start:426 stop:692 length:267 start_codon:yes stop_codon:yes gene_type:complete